MPSTPARRLPVHGWLGLALLAVGWSLSWGLDGLRTHALFFPQWLGAILLIDGLVMRRDATSLLHRSPRRFAMLFVVSVPLWWLFELVNVRTQNWEYLGREQFGPLADAFWSSLSFSTVVPALFEVTELVLGWRGWRRLASGPVLTPTPRLLRGLFLTGAAMLALLLAWPRLFYPFLWTSFVLMLEPVCVHLGRRSLFTHIARGDWRRFFGLWVGALLCGVLWEFWNLHAYPKWTYNTPGVEFLHVFEMPLLGYLGYFAFGLEAYVFTHLVWPRAPELRIPGAAPADTPEPTAGTIP